MREKDIKVCGKCGIFLEIEQSVILCESICSACNYGFLKWRKAFDAHCKKIGLIKNCGEFLSEESWIWRREFWKWIKSETSQFDQSYGNKEYFGAIEMADRLVKFK